MPLTPDLVHAYEDAIYEVRNGPVLRIGKGNLEVDALLAGHGVRTAAFVTAANPRGRAQSHAANGAAMAELRALLSYPYLEGEGRDPGGRWTPEPSLLVLGIGRPEAEALGRRFEQNAIVFMEAGKAPELVFLVAMRLVLDTQVWLDWLVFDEPSVSPLRSELEAGRAEVVIDQACLAELERVLAYPLGGRVVDAGACLNRVRTLARRFDGRNATKLPLCRDPDDQKFLELAAAALADCLVTRDRALLRLSRRCAPWFRIVPPEAFSRSRHARRSEAG